MKISRTRRWVILLALVLAIGVPLQATAAPKTSKTVRGSSFGRGEQCIIMKNLWTESPPYVWHCFQDNNRINYGLRTSPPVCANNLVFACLAKWGQLVAGGWHFLYGDGLAYGYIPNTHLANVFRTSSYIAPYSTMEQSFFARARVAGAFANGYGPNARICLEVFDWGESVNKSVYINQTSLGTDCLRPGDELRTLEVTGAVGRNHLVWVRVSLWNEEAVGISEFTIVDVTHDIS